MDRFIMRVKQDQSNRFSLLHGEMKRRLYATNQSVQLRNVVEGSTATEYEGAHMKLDTILDHVDAGSMALPEFQRGYVWNRDQVRGLMDSLYRKHPVGSLLVWETKTESATVRGDGKPATGTVKLLLDGQQRVTSLYGIIRGCPPPFFDGNSAAFTGLYFNLDDEIFEFSSPVRVNDNPIWINVTDLMKVGVGEYIKRIMVVPELQGNITVFIDRLNNITSISDINFHIDEITGEDKSVDVVVEIFNRVNSGGTKLSKGDLALAKICAEWPEARDEMKLPLKKWDDAGFYFKLDWLLRCVNTIVTGEALFSALSDVSPSQVRDGLEQAEKAVDTLLNLISSRLGLDHDRVLGSRYSFPLLVHYLARRGGNFADYRESDRALYWYIHTFLWGRYSGSTESVLNQDLGLIEDLDGGLDRLIDQLRQNRGDLRVHPNDFRAWSRGARFYPLMYMLTRVDHARDWGTGVELNSALLGKLSGLQVHHIFPKALLYQHGYSMSEVNQLANFTFLTQETNLQISDRNPAEYLKEIATKQPGVLESHWMPMDRELWRIENYREFLDARRTLLAKSSNDFLDSLVQGAIPASAVSRPVMEMPVASIPGAIVGEEEEILVLYCATWVRQQGLPEGELMYELTDEETHEALAVFDLAWPEGLQPGLSQPVALLLNEPQETEEIANAAGFRYFLNVETFKNYVRREVLAYDHEEAAD